MWSPLQQSQGWLRARNARTQHAPPCELKPTTLDALKGTTAKDSSAQRKLPGVSTSGAAAASAAPPALVSYRVVPSSAGDGSQALVLLHAAQSGLDTVVHVTEVDGEGRVVATQQHRCGAGCLSHLCCGTRGRSIPLSAVSCAGVLRCASAGCQTPCR